MKINWHCKINCNGEAWFTFFTIVTLLLGLSELMIGVVLHCIRFHKFVTDEWFTEFFAVTCGVLVVTVALIGIYVQNSESNIQKKYHRFSFILLVPVFYQGLSCLVFSLPVLYRDINLPVPDYIPGSQVHHPTFERMIYVRVIITINFIALTQFFLNIIFSCFTICHSNSQELEDKEIACYEELHMKDRGKYAKHSKSLK